MSANSWRVCPKCKARAEAEKAAAEGRARNAYGKVSASKYAALAAEASAPICLEDSLREDYYVGLSDDGSFHVQYRAECQTCGFTFAWKEVAAAARVDEIAKKERRRRA